MGQTKSSVWCGLPTSLPAIVNSLLHYCLIFHTKLKKDNSLYLAESCLHLNAAQYSIVRVFAASKYNIKANKNVTAHLNHVKNTGDAQSISQPHRGGGGGGGVKGLLAADCSKWQTLMNMSASKKNYFRPEFRTFRTDSQ